MGKGSYSKNESGREHKVERVSSTLKEKGSERKGPNHKSLPGRRKEALASQ